MTAFWVIGGVYESTRFEKLVEGAAEERLGPFGSYEEAERAWAKISWQHVDHATTRYRIVAEEDAAA